MAVTGTTLLVSSAAADTALYVAAEIGVTMGLSGAAIVALGGGLAMGAGVLAGQLLGGPINAALGLGPPAPSQVSAQLARGMLVNVASNIDPLPVIYGSRRVGGTMVLCEASGADNGCLHIIIALGEGEISAINTVYLDDVPSTDARFANPGMVTIEKYLGTDTQAASAALMAALSGKWTSAHQGRGVAYLYVRLLANQYAPALGQSNPFHGLPTITADVDGRLLYDPRTITTAFSHNAALAVRDYLTNTRYGRGITMSLIDDASFSAAANYCDTTVAIPGGTQARYTCDGVVNVDDTVYANIQRLLSACRGMLVFSGGKYKLVIDKQETPSNFAFTEDNITGAWQINKPGKRDKINRISANFFNPANNWQPDLAIQESAAYRAQDNGLLLERKMDLPFTADLYRAQHIAQMEMKQTRIGTTVQFTAFQEGLRCEVGDVVPITHSTPGWSTKPFRILTIDILDSDEINILAREYSDAVYALDTLNTAFIVPQTNLPDPFVVGLPGTPVVVEELYATRDSAGVKSRARVSCAASMDAFVRQYQLEYKLAAVSEWGVLPPQASTNWALDDLAPGVYDWRVAGINSLSVTGAYSTSRQELYGLLARPADITGFSVQPVSSLAILTWTQSPDLDVRAGGRILVRHSPAQTGASWEASTSLGDPHPGDSSNAVLPLLPGTYLIKSEDSSGLQSVNATAFSTDGTSLFAYTTLGSVQEDPMFPGTFSNTYHDSDVGSAIELVGVSIFDDGVNFDAGENFDCAGGIVTSGHYNFAAGLDLGTVRAVRLTATLAASAENVLVNFDDGANFDAGLDFDNTAGAPVDAWIETRSTNDDPAGAPTWGAWKRVSASDFTARAFQFRAQLVSSNSSYNIAVNHLQMKAEAL